MGEQEFWGVIGVSISYVVSFLGLALAWWTHRKRERAKAQRRTGGDT